MTASPKQGSGTALGQGAVSRTRWLAGGFTKAAMVAALEMKEKPHE